MFKKSAKEPKLAVLGIAVLERRGVHGRKPQRLRECHEPVVGLDRPARRVVAHNRRARMVHHQYAPGTPSKVTNELSSLASNAPASRLGTHVPAVGANARALPRARML